MGAVPIIIPSFSKVEKVKMNSNNLIWMKNEDMLLFGIIILLTLFRMGLFGDAHGWGGDQKRLHSLKSVTHILY